MVCISVIIPAYNCGRYIDRCIDSIVNQNIDGVEIICIEDGSDDDTLNKLKELELKYDFISLIANSTNRGQSYSRNIGIRKAKGEYILFVDADDYIEADCLYELYDTAKTNDLDLLYFEYKQEFENEKVKNVYVPQYLIRKKDTDEILTGQERFIRYCKNGLNNVMPVLALYKNKFLRDNKIFFLENVFHEDDLFYLQCLLQAVRTSHISRYVYNYYLHTGTTMTSTGNREKRVHDLFIVISEMQKIGEKFSGSKECDSEFTRFLNSYRDTAKIRYESLINDGFDGQFDFSDLRTQCDFLYITKGIHKITYSISVQDRIDEIKKYKNLIVYGAGKIAIEVISELHKNGFDNFQIAVSDTDGDEYFYGNKVRQINDYITMKEEALVLVSVSKKYSGEVMKRLSDLGFNNRINVVHYR